VVQAAETPGVSCRAVVPWLVAGVGYLALTLLLLWPAVRSVSSVLVHDAGDPALNVWILWWNAHAVPLTTTWWNAPNFWPGVGSLSLSEHLLGISVVTTPLQWLGASPLTAYNVALLLSYPLTALAAHVLAFSLVKRHDAALLAGLVFGFSPYRTAHLAHIQVLWAFGMPLALAALHRFLDRRHAIWLVAFGAAWLAQALANGYYLLFFPVLLGGWILWFAAGRSRAATASILVAWAIASLPLVPVLWTYRRVHAALGLERTMGEVEQFSAGLTSVFSTSADMVLWHGLSRWARPEGELFPGALALGLVVFGGVAAFRRQRRASKPERPRPPTFALASCAVVLLVVAASPLVLGPWRLAVGGRVLLSAGAPDKPLSIALLLALLAVASSRTFLAAWRRRSVWAFYALSAAATFMLSLGPRPTVRGVPLLFRSPYGVLMELPGFSQIRSPARFGMLFVLSIAVAAAVGFARLSATMSRRSREILAGALAAVVVCESWSVTRVAAIAPAIPLLAMDASAHPVIELPLGDPARDVAAQYRSMAHGRPVVNGYSGYAPPHFGVLSIGLHLDDPEVLAELARDRPITLALDRREEFERWSALVDRLGAEVVGDSGDWRVYRLAAQTRPAVAMSGVRLPVVSVTANVGPDWVGRMLDGDVRTEWNSRRVQGGREEVAIDLGAEHDVSRIRMSLGPFTFDFPRRLVVECGSATGSWQECWRGSTTALAMRAVVEDAGNPVIAIPIDRTGVRRLRLRQTAVDPTNGWSIAELAVFGR
jgi:hypothetical protein